VSKLPPHVSTLFQMLAIPARSRALSAADWRSILEFADRTQLTLHLRSIAGLPEWVREEIEARFTRNAKRRFRLREVFTEIAQALSTAGIDFVLLKGFTHETGFGLKPGARVQYDIDLLSPQLGEARRVLRDLGYRPHGAASLSEEHDHPWVRPSNRTWAWRGDYFDPEMPVAVELHSTPWNPRRDRIAIEGIEQFWRRRQMIEVSGISVPAYSEPDRLAFAGVHVLRHVLRNDARPAHVYELARFLETRRSDTAFWARWQFMQTEEMRIAAAVAFRFAHEWFGCGLPEAVEQDAARLPDSVTAWFREFAWSPVVNLIRPNKDVVWLHMALVPGLRDRLAVIRSRLTPLRIPHGDEAPDLPSRFGRAHMLWKRLRYHAAGSTLAVTHGLSWCLRRTTSSTTSHTSDWNRSRV
jgi:hypothetical protein